MREWNKYWILDQKDVMPSCGVDDNFHAHQITMGGYEVHEEGYTGQEDFFKKYIFYDRLSRHKDYDTFLRRHLRKSGETLSIAAGRCANELYLMQDGYDITCSDLDYFKAYNETKQLFPNLKFNKLDILKEPSSKMYDQIICISLIYLFDNVQLEKVFKHMSLSLKPGGQLILDSAGCPDNGFAHAYHERWLKGEAYVKQFLLSIKTGKPKKVVPKQHGFRRTDKEIIECAQKTGFRLANQENYGQLTEFSRSYIFRRMIGLSKVSDGLLAQAGKTIPYVRMYDFRKES